MTIYFYIDRHMCESPGHKACLCLLSISLLILKVVILLRLCYLSALPPSPPPLPPSCHHRWGLQRDSNAPFARRGGAAPLELFALELVALDFERIAPQLVPP